MPSSAGVGAANQQLGNIQGLINFFMQMAQGNTNQASAAFQQFLQGSGPFQDNPLFGMNGANNLMDATQGFRGGLQNPLSNFSLPPQMQQLFDSFGQGANIANYNIANGGQTGDTQAIRALLNNISQGQTGPQAGMQSLADRILGNYGMTGSMGTGLENAQALSANGGMTGNLQGMSDTGAGILSKLGYGPETQGGMDFFSKIMQNGGRDAGTQGLVDQGKSLMSNGGFTPQMSDLLSTLKGGMASGGMTPQSQQLFDKMMGIVNNNGQGGALMPMSNAISMARDEAATGVHNQAQAALRSAMQRQGASAGSGIANGNMAEFNNQGVQAEGQAVRDTAKNQQSLQLQQLLGAAGIGGDLTKAASTLLGQYAGNATDLMKTGAGNIGTGAGLMGQGESLAATRMGQGIGGFQDTIKNTLDRLGLGQSMVTGAQSAANQRSGLGIQGIQGFNQDAFNNQTNAAKLLSSLTDQSLNAGQGLTALTGLEFNNQNDAYKNLLGIGQLQNGIFSGQQGSALQGNAQYIDAFLKSLGLQSDMSNSFTNQWFQGANGLTNIGQLFSSLVGPAMGAYGQASNGLINAQMQPGFWGNLLNTIIGGGMSGLTGGLSGLITRGGPSRRGAAGNMNTSGGGGMS